MLPHLLDNLIEYGGSFFPGASALKNQMDNLFYQGIFFDQVKIADVVPAQGVKQCVNSFLIPAALLFHFFSKSGRRLPLISTDFIYFNIAVAS
jgi:hypothetical protein